MFIGKTSIQERCACDADTLMKKPHTNYTTVGHLDWLGRIRMENKNKKSWYMSKTVWGAGVGLLVAIVSTIYGETSPIVSGIIAVASAFGIYGRITATQELK